MEVLAIIAYNQPPPGASWNRFRGVDSSGIVSSLAEKA
jgi:chromosome segregation and condensation protein ScpB